jgi:hypothetical protein
MSATAVTGIETFAAEAEILGMGQTATEDACNRKQIRLDSEIEAHHQIVLALGHVDVADDFGEGDDDRQQADRTRSHLVHGAGGDGLAHVLRQSHLDILTRPAAHPQKAGHRFPGT